MRLRHFFSFIAKNLDRPKALIIIFRKKEILQNTLNIEKDL